MNCGPHHAREPVTNATHVNASVDSINDGLKHTELLTVNFKSIKNLTIFYPLKKSTGQLLTGERSHTHSVDTWNTL